ncbi:MAG: hypothetical protein ACRD2I_21310 [Vicinamibacterales bacterium]
MTRFRQLPNRQDLKTEPSATIAQRSRLSAHAALLLIIVFAQVDVSAKVVEDRHYRFRADLPGILSDRIDESDGKGGPLAWRTYTSRSPSRQTGAEYTAAVKVFETNSTDTRVLFEAGENDASQSLGITLVGRRDGTFGVDRLPSVTLSFQSGRDGAPDMQRATVLLVVKGRRLYEVTFAFNGAADQSATGKTFFQTFKILK